MAVLKERLDKEFAAAHDWHESIEGFIRKSTATSKKFFDEAQKDENNGPETNDEAGEAVNTDSDDSSSSADNDSEGYIELVGV